MTLELQSFLCEQEIVHETSTPHVHQQNGRAEWLNQTLLEKAQSMQLEACLPDSWWEFAFATATHVYNYTSIKHLKWKTPQEIFTSEKPKISHLHCHAMQMFRISDDLHPNNQNNQLERRARLP